MLSLHNNPAKTPQAFLRIHLYRYGGLYDASTARFLSLNYSKTPPYLDSLGLSWEIACAELFIAISAALFLD